MKIVVTGQVGVDKKEFIKRVAKIAKQQKSFNGSINVRHLIPTGHGDVFSIKITDRKSAPASIYRLLSWIDHLPTSK